MLNSEKNQENQEISELEKSLRSDLTVREMMLYMQSFGLDGNIIDHSWYKIIKWKFAKKTPEGKPHREAIELLADIVYWYRPTATRNIETGDVKLSKKFKSDLLQRSYVQIEDQLGMTKKEAVSAFLTLEKLKVAKRVFRTITVNGMKISNVLFIRFYPQRIKHLQNEYLNKSIPYDVENIPLSLLKETPPSFKRETNTETSTQTTLENNNRVPDTPTPKIPNDDVVVVVFKSLEKLNLPEDYKRNLSRQHDKDKIDLLVKRVERWKDKESDHKACNAILMRWDSWVDQPTKEEQEASKVVRMEDIKSKAEVRREKALKIKEMVPDVEFSVKENLIEISKETRGKISYHVVGFADEVLDKYFKTIEKKYSLSI